MRDMLQWQKYPLEVSYEESRYYNPRLILQTIADKDEDAMLDLLTDPIVGKTYMIPEFPERAAARPLFEKIKGLSASEKFVYGVYLDDTLIGFVNEVEIQGKTIELGYAYLPQYHNQGYATEVLLACTWASRSIPHGIFFGCSDTVQHPLT